jgi:hypothetical protein
MSDYTDSINNKQRRVFMKSQKDVVFSVVLDLLTDKGVEYDETVAVSLTKEEIQTCAVILTELTDVEVEVKSDSARTDLPKYWRGTVRNWLKKDTRLSGGVKHVIKNPGSRAGAGDPELRELKKLLAKVTETGNEEHIAAVTEAIEKREAKIAEERAAKVQVDMALIPDYLKAKLG